MSPAAENLRVLLENRDIDGYLHAYEVYSEQAAFSFEPGVTALSQRVFPSVLRRAFLEDRVEPATVVRLYRMAATSRLVLVENDLILGINLRVNDAMRQVEPETPTPVRPLATVEEVPPRDIRWSPADTARAYNVAATEVKRVAVVSTFAFGTWSAVDAFDFRRNACASQQEREFLQAVRQFFPSLQAYPNVPVKNFIDIDRLESTLPERVRSAAHHAHVAVMLCTRDEDPVAGIELKMPDGGGDAEQCNMKNLLFKLAGLPLIRIQAGDATAVRAEGFYDLLMAESKVLDTLRPRRLRPRRAHDFLVPAQTASRSNMAAASALR
jgi:hypothetical protein